MPSGSRSPEAPVRPNTHIATLRTKSESGAGVASRSEKTVGNETLRTGFVFEQSEVALFKRTPTGMQENACFAKAIVFVRCVSRYPGQGSTGEGR